MLIDRHLWSGTVEQHIRQKENPTVLFVCWHFFFKAMDMLVLLENLKSFVKIPLVNNKFRVKPLVHGLEICLSVAW